MSGRKILNRAKGWVPAEEFSRIKDTGEEESMKAHVDDEKAWVFASPWQASLHLAAFLESDTELNMLLFRYATIKPHNTGYVAYVKIATLTYYLCEG